MSIVWEGVEAMQGALEERVVRANAAARAFVTKGLHIGEANMKLRAREGGRHKKGTPTPAQQGSGPAVISGTLGRSIRVGKIVGFSATGWEGEVGPTAVYGRRVELDYNYPFAEPGWMDTLPELAPLARELYGAAVI